MPIRRSALRFPPCCIKTVSGMRPFENFYAPPSVRRTSANLLLNRPNPVDANHLFDLAKPSKCVSKCVAMIDLWRQSHIVSFVRQVVSKVNTSALTFYPLPQERKWLSAVSGFADHHPINPVAVFSKRRRTILPLLGERAGVGERKHQFHCKC